MRFRGVDVRDRDVRTCIDEKARQARADVPGALHDDSATREVGRTERLGARRTHPVQHPERSDRRRVARPTPPGIDARHPWRLPRDAVHVTLGRADILGREVPATEHVDPPSE